MRLKTGTWASCVCTTICNSSSTNTASVPLQRDYKPRYKTLFLLSPALFTTELSSTILLHSLGVQAFDAVWGSAITDVKHASRKDFVWVTEAAAWFSLWLNKSVSIVRLDRHFSKGGEMMSSSIYEHWRSHRCYCCHQLRSPSAVAVWTHPSWQITAPWLSLEHIKHRMNNNNPLEDCQVFSKWL